MSKKSIKLVGKNVVDSIFVNKKERIILNSIKKELGYNKEFALLTDIKTNKKNKYKLLCLESIERKINSYKAQDLKKKSYYNININDLITCKETVHKLYESKLLCDYCKCQIKILYRTVRDPCQWTLDRIDNCKGHSNLNTIISCLKCNLKRRVLSKKHFEFNQNLKITRLRGDSVNPLYGAPQER